jgi:hypothetical protein
VTRAIDSDFLFGVDNPVVSAVLKFGLPFDVFLGVYLFLRIGNLAPGAVVEMVLATLFLNIAPVLIWRYDRKEMPNFFQEVSQLLQDEERLSEIAENYDGMIARDTKEVGAAFSTLTVIFFVLSSEAVSVLGITGLADPFYWIFLLLVAWVGFLGGMGATVVWATISSIKAVTDMEMRIDPLNPDQLGGLSVIGDFAIHTTIFLASGSLLVPMMIQFGLESSLAFIGVGFYSVMIAVSFFYPTYKTASEAQEQRSKELDNLREEYEDLTDSLQEARKEYGTASAEHNDLELSVLRNRREYKDYSDMKLYPFEKGVLAKMLIAATLPVVSILLDIFLETQAGTLLKMALGS